MEERVWRRKQSRRSRIKQEKLKALDAAISQIEKQYGKGAVMKLGDSSSQMNVEECRRFTV